MRYIEGVVDGGERDRAVAIIGCVGVGGGG
jgi:hypothetical protein